MELVGRVLDVLMRLVLLEGKGVRYMKMRFEGILKSGVLRLAS